MTHAHQTHADPTKDTNPPTCVICGELAPQWDTHLVDAKDIAEMAGVTLPAVVNWQTRRCEPGCPHHIPFPQPVIDKGPKRARLFHIDEVREWLSKTGRKESSK